jgi:hypothetical protein
VEDEPSPGIERHRADGERDRRHGDRRRRRIWRPARAERAATPAGRTWACLGQDRGAFASTALPSAAPRHLAARRDGAQAQSWGAPRRTGSGAKRKRSGACLVCNRLAPPPRRAPSRRLAARHPTERKPSGATISACKAELTNPRDMSPSGAVDQNAIRSPEVCGRMATSGRQPTPLGQSDGAVLPEDVAAVEVMVPGGSRRGSRRERRQFARS